VKPIFHISEMSVSVKPIFHISEMSVSVESISMPPRCFYW
jgi:hypothetical protein